MVISHLIRKLRCKNVRRLSERKLRKKIALDFSSKKSRIVKSSMGDFEIYKCTVLYGIVSCMYKYVFYRKLDKFN